MRYPDDIEAHLVFFSTFEELKLPAMGPMDHATTKLYKQSPTLILHVGPCDLMQGATLSLVPERLRYSHHTTEVATPQGQCVPVRNRRRSRRGWQ